MTTTLVPKKSRVKEPSIEQLAKQKAKGDRPSKPRILGDWYDESLKRQLGEVLDGPPEMLLRLTPEDRTAAADLLKKDALSDQERFCAEMIVARAKPINGNGHPSLTGTTTPAGIAANDRSADGTTTERVPGNGKPEKADIGDQIVQLPIGVLQRHPDNRHPTKEAIDKRAESMQAHGQLEPIVVRPFHWGPNAAGETVGKGEYQILSGETRWLAAKKLGRKTIDARIRRCDDTQALEYLAEANAARDDLNPIEKARLIERLCQPIAEGGAGKTREQAGNQFGLKDGASASNLVRLLKLPKVWQDRVAAGELPESFARLIVPICHAPKLMDQLNAEWEKDHRPGADESSHWETRDDVEREVHRIFEKFTRPVNPSETFEYGYEFRSRWGKVDDVYAHERHFPVLFEITPELEQALEIQEFDPSCQWEHRRRGKKDKPLRRATNWKLFDKHQIPAIKARVASSGKNKADRAGRDAPVPKRKLTAAELKERRRQMTESLNGRVAAWRHKLLRRACIAAIEAGLDSGLRIVLAAAADEHRPYGALKFGDALEQAQGMKPRTSGYRAEYWPCVAGVEPVADKEGEVIAAIAKRLLLDEAKDWRRPTLPHSLVESYAAAVGIKLEQAWSNLRDEAGRSLLEELFLLHQTEPLRELAGELGVHVRDGSNRGAIVKILLGKTTMGGHLPLPKCIKPLAGTGGKKKRGRK
jgi:ParB/RepB/Spo0J family partition protein